MRQFADSQKKKRMLGNKKAQPRDFNHQDERDAMDEYEGKKERAERRKQYSRFVKERKGK